MSQSQVNTTTTKDSKATDDIAKLKRNAEQGDAEAQYDLGTLYLTGYKDIKKNHEEALKWIKKAAMQGYAKAQHSIGVHCVCYEGNYEEAVKWFRKAASQGYAAGQYELGVCYYKGTGVDEDEDEAVRWLRKAAAQGYANAKKKLKEIEED